MASQQTFNYDEFLVKFRTACAAHGIDPQTGTTSYQMVHLVVERRRALWKPRRNRWWQRSDRWRVCPPYRSPTEQAAIWHLYQTTCRAERKHRLRFTARPAAEA